MNDHSHFLGESAEELFEDAPCGFVSTLLDGTIVRVNRTFEGWIGRHREDLIGRVRFQELLPPGGRIYHDTHWAPLIHMQGAVREIAVELVRSDGTTLPALINSELLRDDDGQPSAIRTMIFDATDRRRYEQELLKATANEHEIALSLQRSLLPGHLPESADVDIAVHYHAAAQGLEIGGDWYDAFWLEDQRSVALVVGDVVGRGLGAAATMGQLRSAVCALASLGLGPAKLLEALDAYSRRHRIGSMTTLVYMELDVKDSTFRFACAGHPPPLIREPGRRPWFTWEGRSLPVNALDEPVTRTEASLSLSPGTEVFLFTDGLVESRRRPLDMGMEQLADAAAMGRGGELESRVRAIVDALSDGPPTDDLCLLGVKLRSAP